MSDQAIVRLIFGRLTYMFVPIDKGKGSMQKKYHILNGDALRGHFPKQIDGKVLIMRECLVDGDVKSTDLEDLFRIRTNFINTNYGECSESGYRQKCVSEFDEMQNIPKGSEINLWFEDDLFCQVNLWFVISLLNSSNTDCLINLVRPISGHEYSFCSMTEVELLEAYSKKKEISPENIGKFCKLWEFYQNDNREEMIQMAKELNQTFPFIMPACQAHVDRSPIDGSLGRPERSIILIMKKLETTDFVQVFREFCKRESIYGFGDLQFKRLFDNVTKNT